MGTNTNNHGFGKPTLDGDTDVWGEILNTETIDKLEERVILVDAAANRTNYSAYADALFVASDSGQVYVGNGASWDELDVDVSLHSSTHEDGGADEIDATGLAVGGATTDAHASRHENGGADEISVTGLSGDLADAQDPKVHASTHESGGADQLSNLTLTVLANQDYNETVTTHATASGTVTLDLSTANVHRVEATGNVTLEVSNVTGSPAGNSVLVKLLDDDGTGPHTISYGTSWNTILWDNGTVRDTIPASSNIRLSFETDDGGTNWWGIRSGSDFA